MSGIDNRFITTSDVDTYYVDKDTGLPLAAGKIYFYQQGTTTPKPVYTQVLTGSTYSYVALPNPLTLSAVGTIQDGSGANIIPYYWPYDGNNITSDMLPQLYTIQVFDSGMVPQLTRNVWPNINSSGSPSGNTTPKNYIPNGQFLANNPPLSQISFNSADGNTYTPIAQGGWYFVQTTSGSGTYSVTFQPIAPGLLDDTPRNTAVWTCSVGGNAGRRDFAIQFPNASTFSGGSPQGQQPFTFMFAGQSQISPIAFQVYLICNYGTGGSPSTPYISAPTEVIVGNTWGYYYVNVTPPNNTGATLGTNNDDYVSVIIRAPASVTFSCYLTDFAFMQGENVNPVSFPYQTQAEMLDEGIAGWMPTPAYDGSDLYLPLVLTPKGMKFDHSIVGEITAKTQTAANPNYNELLMNGTTYTASAYSPIGIPYQRLMNYLLFNSPNVSISGTASLGPNAIPLTGTGPAFVTLFSYTGQPTEFLIQMNTASASGSATQVSGSITIAATSANNYYTATVASVPSPGDYWTFTAPTVAGQPTSGLVYNVWYSVNGVGSPPAIPTGANIQVSLVSADTLITTANKTVVTVDQYQFYLPNLAGLFLRGWDPTGIYDLDHASRTIPGIMFNGTAFSGTNGAAVGTLELQAFLSHNHAITDPSHHHVQAVFPGGTGLLGPLSTNSGTAPGSSGNTADAATGITINNAGGSETRPVNLAVNWFIRY